MTGVFCNVGKGPDVYRPFVASMREVSKLIIENCGLAMTD